MEKNKCFTKTRNNYKNYNEVKFDWNGVFNEIDCLKEDKCHKPLLETAKKYNINQKTLRNKYSKWKKMVVHT